MLHHGDCLEVLKDYSDGFFDCILSDPPEPVKDAPRTFLASLLDECLRVCHGPIIWLGVPMNEGRFQHEFKRNPDVVLDWLQGIDGFFGAVTKIYFWNMDKPKPKLHPFMGHVLMSDLRSDRRHRAEKDVQLAKNLLNIAGLHSDAKVLDPCMGSGWAGIACARLELPFVGIEKDEARFEMAQENLGCGAVT